MKISFSIMAHPKRESFIPSLQEQLNCQVAWDEKNNVWDTCRRAWLLHDPSADYHCVIQDDAILCKDFIRKAHEFVEKYDGIRRNFNFYYGKRQNVNRHTVEQGKIQGFLTKNRNAWGVAICVPTHLIPEMIAWCDKQTKIRQDDIRIGRFLATKLYVTYYPMPSLVNHRNSPSLVGDMGKGRVAEYFLND